MNNLFPRYNLGAHLLSDYKNPISEENRVRIIARLDTALEEILKAEKPSVNAWGDLCDAMNLLQSMAELGWVVDPNGALDASKAALLSCYTHAKKQGVIRLDAQYIGGLKNLIEQMGEILEMITEREFLTAIKRTEIRIAEINRGKVKKGDKVVRL